MFIGWISFKFNGLAHFGFLIIVILVMDWAKLDVVILIGVYGMIWSSYVVFSLFAILFLDSAVGITVVFVGSLLLTDVISMSCFVGAWIGHGR